MSNDIQTGFVMADSVSIYRIGDDSEGSTRADIVGLLTIKTNILDKAGTTPEYQMNWIVEALEILLKRELYKVDKS